MNNETFDSWKKILEPLTPFIVEIDSCYFHYGSFVIHLYYNEQIGIGKIIKGKPENYGEKVYWKVGAKGDQFVLHREDGPATFYSFKDNPNSCFLNGIPMGTESEFQAFRNKKLLKEKLRDL